MSIPQEAIDFVHSQKLMTIATFGDAPWAAAVYFVMDSDLNIYFISSPDTIHCQNITLNPNVAITITDSSQEVTDKKVGVQISGEAEQISGLESIKWFFKMFNKLNPGVSDILNFENYKNRVLESKVYKVTPKRLRFFNEKMYPDSEGESEIFNV